MPIVEDQLSLKILLGIGKPSYDEYVENGNGLPESHTVYTDNTKAVKIRRIEFTYDGQNQLTTSVTILYDEAGATLKTITETYSDYTNGIPVHTTRVVS